MRERDLEREREGDRERGRERNKDRERERERERDVCNTSLPSHERKKHLSVGLCAG